MLVCGSVTTPLNANNFLWELQSHPNNEFCDYIVSGIREGFDLGVKGNLVSFSSGNMKSANQHSDVVSKYIATETKAGRIKGPFKTPPFSTFRCSPIGVVPKKTPGKFRMIMNLSSPTGSSINDAICKDDFSLNYVSVDKAIDYILNLGPGCLLSKVDIESAFRIVPVKNSQWNLLGFHWDNQYYFDTVLSMGGRSSPAIFNAISDAAEWICTSNYQVDNLIHLLDDFLAVEERSKEGYALSIILNVFRNLGIPVNNEKVDGPATCLEFLGIILDT